MPRPHLREAEGRARRPGAAFGIVFEVETARGMRLGAASLQGHEVEVLIAGAETFRVVRTERIGNVLYVTLRDGTGKPTIGLSA